MILTFLSHQWKAFWRGRSAGKNLAAQLFIGFIVLYLSFMALVLGLSLRHSLAQFFPGQHPIVVFCGFILYYFALDLFMRFMLQELPVLSIQPYLSLNIKRNQLVRFLNIRSLFHFLNLLPLFLFIPFTATTIASRYGAQPTIAFTIAVLSLILFNHFLILYIKRKTIINSWWTIGLLSIIGIFVALDYFHITSLQHYSALIFTSLLKKPALVLIFIAAGVAAFLNNTFFLRRNLYLEEISSSRKNKGVQRQSAAYTWIQQWGMIGQLLALNIKLMLRNKRPKSVLLFSCLILLYGFIFYKPEFLQMKVFGTVLMAALMITGIFVINYGQFVFAWHSSYFDGLMSLPLDAATLIRSNFLLFTAFSTLSFAITSFYGLISWTIIPIQLAAYLYNIGINSVLALYFGTRSYKGIDLGKSATFNYQGTGMAQWLYSLTIILVPLLIYWGISKLFNQWAGIAVVGLLGLISLLFRSWWVNLITAQFQQRKYMILDGFREK